VFVLLWVCLLQMKYLLLFSKFQPTMPLTIYLLLSSFNFSIYLFHTINEEQFCKPTHYFSFSYNINYIS
jgi:hypothetical protein